MVDEVTLLQHILDASRDGLLVFDLSGNLLRCNPAAEKLLGIDLEHRLNSNFIQWVLAQDPPEPVLVAMSRLLRFESYRITRREFERVVSDEQTVFIEEVGTPIFDELGKISGRLLALRDITEEKQLALEHEEIKAMMMHNLWGPLSTMMSGLTLAQELLKNSGDPQTVDDLLTLSLEMSTDLLKIVGGEFDILRPSTPRMPLKTAPFPVADLVRSALLPLSAAIKQTQVTVTVAIPDAVPPVHVNAEKLRRLFVCLLDNALRYVPDGGALQIDAQALPDQQVMVRVADSGAGILPEERQHVFTKFWVSRKVLPLRGRRGAGLGLAFCKQVVEAHEGHIWVEEHGPLAGACIAFTLPTRESIA